MSLATLKSCMVLTVLTLASHRRLWRLDDQYGVMMLKSEHRWECLTRKFDADAAVDVYQDVDVHEVACEAEWNALPWHDERGVSSSDTP